MSKPYSYNSDDYIGLKAKNAKFYYGYETSFCKECQEVIVGGEFCKKNEDHETEWCFVAEFGNEKIIIPFHKLGIEDQCDMGNCILTGIGWILAKYRLSL